MKKFCFLALLVLAAMAFEAQAGPFRNRRQSASGSCTGSTAALGSCSGSTAALPAGCSTATAAPALVKMPTYSWVGIDADECALMFGGKQVGNFRFSDKTFKPFDGAKWGDKGEPPIAAPTTVPAQPAVVYTFGGSTDASTCSGGSCGTATTGRIGLFGRRR